MNDQLQRIRMIDLKENQLFTYKPGSKNVFAFISIKQVAAGEWQVEYGWKFPKRQFFTRTIKESNMVFVHARPK